MNLVAELIRTAPSIHPDPAWSDTWGRFKYCLRGAARPRLTARWFEVLDYPEFNVILRAHPRIRSKLQRPYLHRRLAPAGRLAALEQHYRFVREQLDGTVRQGIYAREGLPLATLPVLEPGRFTLRLSYDIQFEKEGDLNLVLFDRDGGCALFTLTFCVSRFDTHGAGELFIGGLQGHRVDGQHELVVALTRGLHGLRPKALLVFAAQRLAQLWGFSSIRAVGDTEHIYRHFRKRKDLHSSYNDFWTECQGRPLPDGNFELPPVPLTRNLQELPGKKRPVYRRRYEMLAQIGEEMRAQLVPLAPGIPLPEIRTDLQPA